MPTESIAFSPENPTVAHGSLEITHAASADLDSKTCANILIFRSNGIVRVWSKSQKGSS